jgi:hypothetical protein
MSIEHVLAVVPVADFEAAHTGTSVCSGAPRTTCRWRVGSSNGG